MTMTKIFVYLIMVGGFFIQYNILIRSDMIFATYIPNKFYLTSYTLPYLQALIIFPTPFLFLSFDSFYVGQCLKIIIQLKIIKHRIQNIIDIEERDTEFNKCIEQMLLLRKYIQTLKNVYSIYFLVQYFASLYAIAIQVFSLSAQSVNFDKIIKCIAYGIASCFQFGVVYCLRSEEVNNEVNFRKLFKSQ